MPFSVSRLNREVLCMSVVCNLCILALFVLWKLTDLGNNKTGRWNDGNRFLQKRLIMRNYEQQLIYQYNFGYVKHTREG